jgi:CBS domain-containing protein
MRIGDIIMARTGDTISAEVTETVGQAAARLAEKRIGAMPVLSGGALVGIFSERDVIYTLANKGDAALSTPLADAMTVDPVTVSPETRIMSALSLMTRRRIRHLPVVHEGALVGFVSIGDLVKARIDAIEAEAEAMRAYIQTA